MHLTNFQLHRMQNEHGLVGGFKGETMKKILFVLAASLLAAFFSHH